MNDQKINHGKVLKPTAARATGAKMTNSAAIDAEMGNGVIEQVNNNRRPTFVRTSDGAADLYYKDWGTGQTILFVHSWGVNSDLWQYQMTGLAGSGFRCAAYDRRGHGRSSQPWDGYDYDTLAADLNQVIETLKLDKVTLVSHSMAGGEVVRYLTKYGSKRVSKIIITAPNLPFMFKTRDNPDGVDPAFFGQFRAFLKRDVRGALRAGVSGFFGSNPPVSKDSIEWGIDLFNNTSLRALLECNRSNTETDFREEMKNISVPALIVHGDADVSAPIELTANRCAQLIPNAKLKIYKDAPHGIVLTHKDEMTRDIAEFIKD